MIAFTHGHMPRLLDDAIREGVDYLLHGHTHQLRDERIERTRVIIHVLDVAPDNDLTPAQNYRAIREEPR